VGNVTAAALERSPCRPGVRAGAGLASLVLAVALGACSAVTGSLGVRSALRSEGFVNVGVKFREVNRYTTITVTGQAPTGARDPERTAARVVWEHFKFKVDSVDVGLEGRDPTTFSHGELAAQLGPRPAGYDRHTIYGAVGQEAAVGLVIGGVVFVVVVAIAIVAIVLVVRASRRRRASSPPSAPGYGPPPPGYGPPPPGYGPPPA